MKILIDITHPAHAMFFRRVIPVLRERGHELLITSRDKDVTLALLDSFGVEHRCLSKMGGTKFQQLREMVVRDWRLLGVVRQFRPDVILAKHGLYACQVGWLARVPAISFDDTDEAPIQQRLYFPFAWRIYTDRAYRTTIGAKHRTYRAVSPLAYLHPSVFTPDESVVRAAGIDPSERLIICRVVTWASNHDIGHRGFNLEQLPRMIAALSEHGRVLVTSEVPLPAELERYRWRLPPHQLHHVLAKATLYFGESATMATEAAVLGVPPVHVSSHTLWYTQELERRQLMLNERSAESGLATALRILQDPNYQQQFRRRRDEYLGEADNLVEVILNSLEEARPAGETAPIMERRRAA